MNLTDAFKKSVEGTTFSSSPILDILQDNSHSTTNDSPSLDYSSFEGISTLIENVFKYFETIDKPYYDSVFCEVENEA
jgi:hypothetical protein